MLVIAATAQELGELGLASEVRAITRHVDAQVITGGDVSPALIARETAGLRYDVIHMAMHGDKDGFYLPAGIMTIHHVVRLALSAQAKLLFLNACESVVPMQVLHARGVPYVISHAVPVLDEEALALATYYYGYLRGQRDFQDAFQRVDPGDGSLIMLPGSRAVPECAVHRMRRRMLLMGGALVGQVGFWATLG